MCDHKVTMCAKHCSKIVTLSGQIGQSSTGHVQVTLATNKIMQM